MSRFFSSKYSALTPYVPGEQPKDRSYVKLNTNESPFPPCEQAALAAQQAAQTLQLYSDPTCLSLRKKIAQTLSVDPENVICTNGSDEILDLAFAAFCDETHPAAFPDLTYGFYPVFSRKHGVPYREIPLRDDFTVDPGDYCGTGETVFLANPNAPTGIFLPVEAIEAIVRSNPDRVVVVDEAYVDFGAESCVCLIGTYENLLVTRTFSKSRSLAGGRLGFGVACRELIRDLETLRFSSNPYNVNAMTMAAGLAVLDNEAYTAANCAVIRKNRETLTRELRSRGFLLTDSLANFVFARHERLDGKTIYEELRRRGVLVRHFDCPRIAQYNRVTVGSARQIDALLSAVDEILKEDV